DLAAVLHHRRDTAVPIHPDINSLSTRMLLPGSIALALATCTAAELAIIEALSQRGAELSPVSREEITPLLSFALEDALSALRTIALIFIPKGDDSLVLLPRNMLPLPPNLMLLNHPDITD